MPPVPAPVDVRQFTGQRGESPTYCAGKLRTRVEVTLGGEGRKRGAIDLTSLREDMLDVLLNGARREVQPTGDLSIRQAVGEQREYVSLARGELNAG